MMFRDLNSKQVAVALIAGLGFIGAGAAQLEPVLGHTAAVTISSLSAFLAGLIGAITAPFLGNTAMVRDVSNMDGARVVVSSQASPSIAALAAAPEMPSVVPEKGQEAAVAKTAQGA